MINPRTMFKMNKLEYFADFFMVPVFIIFMMHYNQDTVLGMVSALIFGMFSWTLYEYLMHRYLLHNTALFKEQHDDHHRKPKALLGNAPWMTFVATVIAWWGSWAVGGDGFASSYTSGLLIGYLFYAAIHVNLHHGDPKTYTKTMARLYIHHSAHHRGGKTNYGVSVDWWDRVFGTKNHDK